MQLMEFEKLQVVLTKELLGEMLNRDAQYREAIEVNEILKISSTEYNTDSQELTVIFDLYREALH